jgi:hypothetical protein
MAWFMQGTRSYQGSMILFLFYTYTTRCPFHLYWSTKFQTWSSPLISPGMLLNLLLVFSRSHYAGDCLPFFSNPYHAFSTPLSHNLPTDSSQWAHSNLQDSSLATSFLLSSTQNQRLSSILQWLKFLYSLLKHLFLYILPNHVSRNQMGVLWNFLIQFLIYPEFNIKLYKNYLSITRLTWMI